MLDWPEIEAIRATAYTLPTDEGESDGTLEWDAVTAVVVEAEAAGATGLGLTYTDASAASLVMRALAPVVVGTPVCEERVAYRRMHRRIRNLGTHGIAMAAVSAVDLALWDLEARVLDTPLANLLGAGTREVPIYGSGGFTSYDDKRLADQLAGWADQGIRQVKMKVGRDSDADEERLRVATKAVGPSVGVMVDANGAYTVGEAVRCAQRLAEAGVVWFEEPVTSEDLAGLREVRERSPGGVEIAAGEYADSIWTFEAMLNAGALDAMQIDATRCGGITGFFDAVTLAAAHGVPVSAHCAPAMHLAPASVTAGLLHVEWFWDHVQVESTLFDGAPQPVAGMLTASSSSAGNGLALKRSSIERFEST